MKKTLMMASAVLASTAWAGPFSLNGDAAKGETKFKLLCVSCHGEKGGGDGPAAAALNPKPAAFNDATRATAITDEYVYNMIKEGGAANGRSPLMVSWKGAMTDQEIRDVAAYVRSFGKAATAPTKAPAPKAKKK